MSINNKSGFFTICGLSLLLGVGCTQAVDETGSATATDESPVGENGAALERDVEAEQPGTDVAENTETNVEPEQPGTDVSGETIATVGAPQKWNPLNLWAGARGSWSLQQQIRHVTTRGNIVFLPTNIPLGQYACLKLISARSGNEFARKCFYNNTSSVTVATDVLAGTQFRVAATSSAGGYNLTGWLYY
jgi:hypothetical protein